MDQVYGVAIDAGSGIAAAGFETLNAPNYEDWLVKKYGSTGTLLWSDHYNSPDNDTDKALAVAVNASGGVVAGGYETRDDLGEGLNALVRCLDSSGGLLWSTSYNDSTDGDDSVRGVAVDASGNTIVAGDSGTGALLMKIDSTGKQVWTRTILDFGSAESFNAGACDASGNIIVAGFVDYGALGSDWVVGKYSPSGGLLWALTVPEGNNTEDWALAVAVDALGNIFVAGYTNRLMMTQGSDWAVRKFNPSGSLLWERFYDGPSHSTDSANAVAVDADGGVVVAGDTEGLLMLRKYTADGGLAWVREHANPLSSLDTPAALAIRDSAMAVGGGELRDDLVEGMNWLLVRYKFLYDAQLGASSAIQGKVFSVVLSVTNEGDMDMKATGATIFIGSGASLVSLVSSPPGPSDLAPGASRFFTWTYLAREAGAVSFLAGVSGTEFGTGTTAYESCSITVPIFVRASPTLWLAGPGAALDRNVFRPAQGEVLLVRIYPKEAGDISAKVFTASGRLVRTLPAELSPIGAGQSVVQWDGKLDGGSAVQRGVYLVVVEGGGLKEILKVVVR